MPDTQQFHNTVKLIFHPPCHAVAQVASYPVMGKQACILEDIADFAFFRRQTDTFFNIDECVAVKLNPPFLRFCQPADHIDKGGFPCPGEPEDSGNTVTGQFGIDHHG